jgi:hypothetical protein
VDIGNDGVPDNVVVWHGFGASHGTGRCGRENPYGIWRERQPQIAYILTATNDRIDVFHTMTIFGYPSGGIVFLTRVDEGP